MRSRLIFYTGVFSLFACLGFLTLIMHPVRLGFTQAALSVLVSGGFAVGYAVGAVRRRYWTFVVLGLLEGAAFTALGTIYEHNEVLAASGSPLQKQLLELGIGGIVMLVAGYVLFVTFFQSEGARYFKAHTEIALAQEIHRALVPRIEREIGNYSVFGCSYPSGEVGGDIVDLVEGKCWTAYVADVSGHGVSAGVLMAMFKTAVRTTVVAETSANGLLDAVHSALYPLKTPNLFVTAGALHYDSGGQFTLSLAGHPPLLHFRKATGEIHEHHPHDMPLGILPEQTFSTKIIHVERGDILVLLTDGMTEVFDAREREMGIEPVKQALQAHSAKPLPEMFDAMRQVALSFGKQADDQTMLLVRAN